MQDYKVYPNPYVVTNSSNIYTKHYYAGLQRVASKLLEGSDLFIVNSPRSSVTASRNDSVNTEIDFMSYLKKAGLDSEKIETELARTSNGEPDIYYYHGDWSNL